MLENDSTRYLSDTPAPVTETEQADNFHLSSFTPSQLLGKRVYINSLFGLLGTLGNFGHSIFVSSLSTEDFKP